ncbi:efflux RND transporter periplasmic adaptor subunit [Roseivivax sp. CAU 1753]
MRTFFMPVVATAILAGAYAATFGLPSPVAALVGVASDAATAPMADSAAAPGPAGPAGASARPGRSAPATTVVTAPLDLQPYVRVTNAIGTASALRSVDVVSDAGGTVTEVNLAANRQVAAGAALVRLDARTEELNLEIAQANLEQAQETLSRYERLRVNGNSTVTDVTLADARVALRLAQAAAGLAQVALDDRTIRAPIAGRLGLSDIGVGDTLTVGSVIAGIDQSDTLVIEFELPERMVGVLDAATEVLVSTPTFTGRVFQGTVTAFDSRIDSITRSVTVEAHIDNADGSLWPGMTFTVRLIQQSAPLPSLPSTAITWSRDGSGVWIDADGIAERVPVTQLFRRDDTVWIDADIAAGTMIVTEGAQKLRAGARISTPDTPDTPTRPGAKEPT